MCSGVERQEYRLPEAVMNNKTIARQNSLALKGATGPVHRSRVCLSTRHREQGLMERIGAALDDVRGLRYLDEACAGNAVGK